MNEVQKLILIVIGSVGAIAIGILGLTEPPILALGNTLSVALIIAGLAGLGVGPINTAYNAARANVAGANKE